MTAHAHIHSPAFLWLEARFDRFAIGLSGLCAIHCVASSVLLALAASAGGLLDPRIHEVGLSFAMLFGVVALGRGVMRHGYMLPAVVGAGGLGMMAGAVTMPHGTGYETVWTLLGVAVLALGHDLNRRATY
ncbi:MAG TPA: MerC domain-containing protein [Sphingomonas sp.]|nr:MerC domain-containing protein [Sphingomonas sp.]